MNKITSTLLTVLFVSCSAIVLAQNPGDTILVETFNYAQTYTPNGRDTVISFPNDPGVTYEKILMKYNMRCKDGAVNTSGGNGVACGEWDYSCNTYIHDSSKIDSVRYFQNSHTISGFDGTSFNYTNQELYDYYQHTQKKVTLNNVISETQHGVLSGGTNNYDVGSEHESGKHQFLYTASEMTTSGMSAGNIDGMLLEAINAANVHFLRIKIKHTAATSLDPANPELAGFTEVYFHDFSFVPGSNRLQFYTPFVWNGTDNLIIEVSFTNTGGGSALQLQATNSGSGILVRNIHYHNLERNAHIDIPTTAFGTINNEITVSFWANGNPDLLPANTTILEGLGAANERDVNIHLPWSNSQMYWDCGGDGNFDRINQPATADEIEDQWNHWAFTKNAVTGIMEIYLNGSLWHSGTGKTRPIDVATMVVGKSGSYGNNYKGSMSELRIWDKALSSAEIADWMNIPLDATHPSYANLVAYYQMSEGTGSSFTDASPQAETAVGNGNGAWLFTRGKDLNRFFVDAGARLDVTMVNGTYDMTLTDILVLDSVLIVPNIVDEHAIVPHPGVIMDDEIITTNTTLVWEANDQYIYDAVTGMVIDTIPVIANETTNITTLEYYRRWPMKFEIMSFVTPYGINLDMGPTGETWTFEVTDLASVLSGDKRMTMERGGQRQEDMDIKFEFIVGTPPAEVLDIREIWRTEKRGYTAIINDDYFAPRDVMIDPAATKIVTKSSITGHGQQGEFIGQQHFIDIDGGSNEYSWFVWKECAENPVYPQGGTWIYDRAGWCPGMATDIRVNDITNYVTPGQVANLDYGLISATGTSNYIVSNKIVQYGAPNHQLDAAIVEVMEPSQRIEYDRFNSICHYPRIRIRNTGDTTLTSLTINYWVNDGQAASFVWNGTLQFLEETEVTLPSPLWLWNSVTGTTETFHVQIEAPNGGTDEYAHNNTYASNFEIPDVMPTDLIVWFRTNNYPAENSYEIVDVDGNVIFSKNGATLAPNTLYRDTVTLPAGCYTYNVYDTDDDGVAFWANSDGNGYTRFQQVGGTIVKSFIGDFGGSIHYNFTTGSPLSYEEINGLEAMEVHPNPTTDEISVSLRGFDQKVFVEVVNTLGAVVATEEFVTNGQPFEGKISLGSLESGLYIVRANDGVKFSSIPVVKE